MGGMTTGYGTDRDISDVAFRLYRLLFINHRKFKTANSLMAFSYDLATGGHSRLSVSLQR